MTAQIATGKTTLNRRGDRALISVVAPAYNEEANLRALYEHVRDVCEKSDISFELLIVENGSKDNSLALLRQLREDDQRLNYIRLSRNFGHQGALTAGLATARGDAVITMDADLQHPPDVLPAMIEKWREGFDVVIAVASENTTQSFARRAFNRLYYASIAKMSGLDLRSGSSDFRLMDRAAVDVMNKLPERARYLRGLTRWIGFAQTSITYEIAERFKGESKFSLTQLVRFAVDGALAFSILPLRLFLMLGFFVAGSALTYAFYIVITKILAVTFGIGVDKISGFTTLAVGVFFLGGVILMGIGFLGEYIGRIYDEVKGRPTFIVWESSYDDGNDNEDTSPT